MNECKECMVEKTPEILNWEPLETIATEELQPTAAGEKRTLDFGVLYTVPEGLDVTVYGVGAVRISCRFWKGPSSSEYLTGILNRHKERACPDSPSWTRRSSAWTRNRSR